MKDCNGEAAGLKQGESESQPSTTLEGKKDESMAETVDSDEEAEPPSLSQLLEVLTDIDTPGITCAAGAVACLAAILGLCVDGVGDVSLPIFDAQAKSLASVADQAPHGKGMETVGDTSVRNTLQVHPFMVTIKNPAWQPALRKLVQQAAESLGVSPNLVGAELYKLLLYEEVSFFKKQEDTEKSDGMLATLVVHYHWLLLVVHLLLVMGANPNLLNLALAVMPRMGAIMSATMPTVNTRLRRLRPGIVRFNLFAMLHRNDQAIRC